MAALCVVSDLLIILMLYFSLLLERFFQKMSARDVQEHILSADDFAVVMKPMPSRKRPYDLVELKAYMTVWVENILNLEPRNFVDPETGLSDQNQNKVFNIYFGENDYTKTKIMLDVAKLLKQKKYLDKKAKLFDKNYDDEILDLNRLAK